VHSITKWATREPGELAGVSIDEGNDHTIRSKVFHSRQRVRRETRLRLFAIADNRRACCFKTRIVSRNAASCAACDFSSESCPLACARIACNSSAGRGMLPICSVAIAIYSSLGV